jgi:hypothetical protein
MEQYSRRFIEELAKHINPTILEFFNKKKNLMNFPTDNAAELIDETLMEYLEGKTSREDLMPIINKIKKSRLQKRARWYKAYNNDIDNMNLDDPKHPLASFISLARSLSPSSFTLMMETASNNLLKEIITDDDGDELLEVTVDNGKLTPPKSMDTDDLKLVNAFISNINMQEFSKEKSVVVDLNTLGKEVVDYHVGKNVLNKISNSCRKLVEYNFSYEAEGSKIYFNLFDNIVIKEDAERPYAIAQFGEILSNAIIQKKLISITSASYDVLDNNLSKIICYAIKREQIANQETRVNEYSYTYFQKIVRFKLKNKKKNLQLIQESLQEFVDNHIAIEKFELKNGVFIITFLPLSDAEIEDLNSDNDKNDKGLLIDTLG